MPEKTAATLKIIEYEEDPVLNHNGVTSKPLREYSADSNDDKFHVRRKFVSSLSCSSLERSQLPSGSAHIATSTSTGTLRHYLINAPLQVVSDLFLPLGYPDSVGPEYMPYQICDSLQGLCSYLRGVVATSAVLTAAGVGDADATAMSAAMTWALRDGLGMIGGLLFSYCTSSLFDAHVKEFRLYADIINDIGLTLDMVAPMAGAENVLYVTSAATICKIMCGIAAGATKGSITQHFCKRGNMADLNAKEGTQETLVSLVGMILGVSLARFLNQLEQEEEGGKELASTVSWTIFNLLTLIHVWINWLGVKLLRLKTLNQERAKVALDGVITAAATQATSGKEATDWVLKATSSIPSPDQVSESLLSSALSIFFPRGVVLGGPLSKVLSRLDTVQVSKTLSEFQNERYAIVQMGSTVYGFLFVGANETDELKAFIHAMTVQKCLALQKRNSTNAASLVSQTYGAISQLFENSGGATMDLKLLEEKGWDVSHRLYLGVGDARIQVATSHSKQD